jgi:hypothetical protein
MAIHQRLGDICDLDVPNQIEAPSVDPPSKQGKLWITDHRRHTSSPDTLIARWSLHGNSPLSIEKCRPPPELGWRAGPTEEVP